MAPSSVTSVEVFVMGPFSVEVLSSVEAAGQAQGPGSISSRQKPGCISQTWGV